MSRQTGAGTAASGDEPGYGCPGERPGLGIACQHRVVVERVEKAS